jgi:hypothetical protein
MSWKPAFLTSLKMIESDQKSLDSRERHLGGFAASLPLPALNRAAVVRSGSRVHQLSPISEIDASKRSARS